MQVLSDLWYGNIAPHERPIPASKEYRQMLKTLSGLGERIREMVSPEQKELLDEYERLYMQAHRNTFNRELKERQERALAEKELNQYIEENLKTTFDQAMKEIFKDFMK